MVEIEIILTFIFRKTDKNSAMKNAILTLIFLSIMCEYLKVITYETFLEYDT